MDTELCPKCGHGIDCRSCKELSLEVSRLIGVISDFVNIRTKHANKQCSDKEFFFSFKELEAEAKKW